MNYWVFSVSDGKTETERISGIDVYKQRMSDAFWGLKERTVDGKRTANIGKLEEGDQVVFYLAGRSGQRFLGTCSLASGSRKLRESERKKFTHGTFFQSNHGVKLANIKIWNTPTPIRSLIETLDFIRNPEVWRCYLQGSIRAISERDYEIIISTHESNEMTQRSSQKNPTLTDTSFYTEARRKARYKVFTNRIRTIYCYSCAVCGKKRFTRSNNPEIESSHIYPKEKDGADDFRNGIALCRLHHWAFDGGLFSIKDDYSIVVEERIKNDSNYEEISRFEGKKIRLPEDKELEPHPIYLSAHRRIHGFE